jgi:hypothetical protein
MTKRVAICLRGAISHINGGHIKGPNIMNNTPYVPFECVKKSLDIHVIKTIYS